MIKHISRNSWWFIVILSLLMATTSLSTDIYLPAMPAMAKELQGNSELTITGFLIGFSLAQLLWGPISDKIGRKIPLYIGVILFIIGSLGCAFSTSMVELVLWRVFQAFGACVGPMLSRAMIRDLFERSQAASMLSTLAIVMAAAPIVGPLIGGQLVVISSWRAIFALLVVIGILMFVSVMFLPETHVESKRNKGSLLDNYKNYLVLLKNWAFMKYTLCVTFFYIAAYAFIAGSPYVYIELFGVSPTHYGYLFGLNIVGIAIMSAVNRRLVNVLRLEDLLRYASWFAVAAVVITVLLMALGFTSLPLLVIGVFAFFSMNGVVAAVTNAIALDKAGNMAGAAAALLGALQYGSGIVSTLLLAVLPSGSAWPMMGIIAVFIILSAAVVVEDLD